MKLNFNIMRILNIRIAILFKIINKLITYAKQDIITISFILLIILWFTINLFTNGSGSVNWLSNYKGVLISVVILSKIYWILCSRFKTNLTINSKEEYFIFSLFKNEDVLIYKILELIIKTIVLNLFLFSMYFYLSGDKFDIILILFLLMISILSELLNSFFYQRIKIKKHLTYIYIPYVIAILTYLLLLCNNKYNIKFLNIYRYINLSNNFLIVMTIIISIVIIIIIKSLVLNNNMECLLFYGNVKNSLNNIYLKSILGLDASLDAQNISNKIFKVKTSPITTKFYREGYNCIIFKNLNIITSNDITQSFYSVLDILMISILISFTNIQNLMLILLCILIMLLSSKINAFFFSDIKNREINKCLPLKQVDFLKGYLSLPIILNLLSSIYLTFLINIKLEFNLTNNIVIIIVIFFLLNIITIIKQYCAIKNLLNIKTYVSNILEHTILILSIYCIIYMKIILLLFLLFLLFLFLFLYISKYIKAMHDYIS